jgi:hypothetical protein
MTDKYKLKPGEKNEQIESPYRISDDGENNVLKDKYKKDKKKKKKK